MRRSTQIKRGGLDQFKSFLLLYFSICPANKKEQKAAQNSGNWMSVEYVNIVSFYKLFSRHIVLFYK